MADTVTPTGHSSELAFPRKRGRNGDMQAIQVKHAKSFRLRIKRHRGKRKSRKENRRRVRPGKSRSRGFVSMGAPFNDNNFLISQRNLEGGESFTGNTNRSSSPASPRPSSFGKVCNIPKNDSTCPYAKVESWRSSADHLSAMSATTESSTFSAQDHSDMSAETSDYSSLDSPVYFPKCIETNEHDVEDGASVSYHSDEIFDEEFEMRNFEAEYSAQQQELREELLKIPRCELEDRYFFLLDQTRMLEEKREEHRKVEELKLQVQNLVEENRRLRRGILH